MKLLRNAAALVLSAALLAGSAFGITPEEAFPDQYTYPGFIDVEAGAWYAGAARVCATAGLMQGTGQAFSPDQILTVGEVAAIAARISEAITGEAIVLGTALPGETVPWYQGYVTYLEEKGISVPDPEKQATRQEFVALLSAVVPEDMLSPINEISALPDTSDPAVLRFYNAGILTGVDSYGTFAPDKTLTRAECAAMIARVARTQLRQSFTPAPYTLYAAANMAPADVVFAPADKTVTAQDYLPYVQARIDTLEIACAENGETFRWSNSLGGEETYKDYVLNGALYYFGVTAADGTALYQSFDVEAYYSRYLELGGTVAQPPEEQAYTLYIGQAGGFTPYSTFSRLDPAEESAALVVHLLTEMSGLTGWNLDVDEITVGKGGVTISWADTSALFAGPPEPQKEEFHVYDSTQLAFTLLDSVQRSVQCAFAPQNPEALEVWFCGPGGDPLTLDSLGVTLPLEQPYSHQLLESLLRQSGG